MVSAFDPQPDPPMGSIFFPLSLTNFGLTLFFGNKLWQFFCRHDDGEKMTHVREDHQNHSLIQHFFRALMMGFWARISLNTGLVCHPIFIFFCLFFWSSWCSFLLQFFTCILPKPRPGKPCDHSPTSPRHPRDDGGAAEPASPRAKPAKEPRKPAKPPARRASCRTPWVSR